MAQDDSFAGFPARLIALIEALNLSRVALSRELAVDKSVVRRGLSGETRPTGHNLTRLTELLRRSPPDATSRHWSSDPPRPEPAPPPAPASRLTISGLRSRTTPSLAADYQGLWGGFFHLSEEALIRPILCCLRNEQGELSAEITDGSNHTEGAAVATPGWLQMLFEVSLLQDRLWTIVLNGIAGGNGGVMTGLVTAGFPGLRQATAVTATPILLLRLGTLAECEQAGGLEALSPLLRDWRAAASAYRVAAGGVATDRYWESLADRELLDSLRLQVGITRNNGEHDHVARMPRNREPMITNVLLPTARQAAGETIHRLRGALGL